MKRPRLVTLFAVLALFLASSYVMAGLLLYTGKISLDEFIRQMPQLADMKDTVFHTALVFTLMFGLLYLLAGAGLLQMKNWGRALTRGLAIFGLLSALVNLIQAFASKDAASFLVAAIAAGLYYWAFYYLGQPAIRAAFGVPPRTGPAPPPPSVPGSDSSA
ncbi:MAG TPA: hypothetical protein VLW54_13405 [Candidatus Acidoferrales bacterium]|nr:hypothetical protein [Candidatus Acidoferrales bacterium]